MQQDITMLMMGMPLFNKIGYVFSANYMAITVQAKLQQVQTKGK